MRAALHASPAAHAPVPSDAIQIRESVPADNHALVELARLTPMAGKISLRIDREPDFFALPQARGETRVFVATFEDRIIGCMSASMQTAYVSGVLERVAHATDLKVHPDFTGRRLAVRLISTIENYLRNCGVDLALSLVADGNQRVMVLTEGRHGTPVPVMLGRFLVDQILPSPFAPGSKRYHVQEAQASDLAEVAEMLDRKHRQRNFAPPVGASDLERAIAGRFRKVMLVREAGQVIATLTVEDTQNFRQNVLVGLPPHLSIALGLVRILALPIPRLRIPRIGEAFATLYVRFLACEKGGEEALRCLLAQARYEAFRHRFTFLSVGLHERDPLRPLVSGLPRLTFTSRAMASSLLPRERVGDLTDQIPYEDYALV